MRDLMLALEVHQSKCYHLGFGSTVIHTDLGRVSWKSCRKIFKEFTYLLIEAAWNTYCENDFDVETSVSSFMLITSAKTYDVNAMS